MGFKKIFFEEEELTIIANDIPAEMNLLSDFGISLTATKPNLSKKLRERLQKIVDKENVSIYFVPAEDVGLIFVDSNGEEVNCCSKELFKKTIVLVSCTENLDDLYEKVI